MDSLGGILTTGLLGNLILSMALLHLGPATIEVIETKKGGAPSTGNIDEAERYLLIKIRIGTKEYSTKFKIKDFMARVTIKLINNIKRLKSITYKVNIKEQPPEKIHYKVNIKND